MRYVGIESDHPKAIIKAILGIVEDIIRRLCSNEQMFDSAKVLCTSKLNDE